MKCFIGIDLGSTTTKAVVMDEHRSVMGRGITNSRSNYDTAASVAKQEAFIDTRFTRLEREVAKLPGVRIGADTPHALTTAADSRLPWRVSTRRPSPRSTSPR